MFLFPYLREKSMQPELNKEIDFYKNLSVEDISNYQLMNFNELWQGIQKNVPFYKNLVESNELPKQIKEWTDFQKLPINPRSYVKEKVNDFSDHSREPDSWISTGGSTGNPLNFPSWKEESVNYESSLWYARDFYNIKRSDRMFRLWGHSHVLGKGLAKYKKIIKFKIGHPLIGFKRFSAYDLSESQLKIAGEEILKFKPNYIIGYSKALQLLAKANMDKKNDFKKLNLKAVIGAAEGFDKEEDRDYIGEIFGSPVGLEYASMETKLLAHTHPDGSYKVIWKNNLVECVDEEGNPAQEGRILVTSLYPRAFPLVRYELGDIISGVLKNENSVYAFSKVKGRDNDFLMMDEDTPIHSEGITHAIKFSDKIVAYQIRYTPENVYTIYVKSNSKLTEQDYNDIRSRLKKVDYRLPGLDIKQVDKLKQTIAGKTKWLIEE
ncbi:phenylacetate--CoA ligase family protein [Oceanobacillus oncorhynchi subsp. oncorhynchi]|uniref:hypothetical protein n=1 Tax=Oceanobacillus oncorhynchi TaxID=545501 RepID=UPI0031D9A1D0